MSNLNPFITESYFRNEYKSPVKPEVTGDALQYYILRASNIANTLKSGDGLTGYTQNELSSILYATAIITESELLKDFKKVKGSTSVALGSFSSSIQTDFPEYVPQQAIDILAKVGLAQSSLGINIRSGFEKKFQDIEKHLLVFFC